MRLQKEEVAVLVLLLFAAVTACALVVVTSGSSGAVYTSSSKAGDIVHLEGLLLSAQKTSTGGHMMLTVRSGTDVVTVYVSDISGATEAAGSAKPGSTVYVEGKVQDYKDQKEVAASLVKVE